MFLRRGEIICFPLNLPDGVESPATAGMVGGGVLFATTNRTLSLASLLTCVWARRHGVYPSSTPSCFVAVLRSLEPGSGWDAHHCLPGPIRGWCIFAFCSLVFLWLIAPEQKQQTRVSYTAEVTKSWTKHSGPPPRKGLHCSTLVTFSFPALLACRAATRHMPPAFIFLHHLGIKISSALDWFPFALYYSLLSSFPLI